MDLPWVDQDAPLARIGREQTLTMRMAHEGQGERRAALEDFIRERFAEHYGARVRHFMPCLIGLYDENGEIQGAAGLRSARTNPLFLERYLDLPVEQTLQGMHGYSPAREQMVEVGNLAAHHGASARLLIVAVTDMLVAFGFRWVLFTGTPGLLNSFQRLGLQPLALGQADPQCMGEELADWGSYYDCHPQVMAGEILPGHERLLRMGAYARLGHQPLYAAGALPHAACG